MLWVYCGLILTIFSTPWAGKWSKNVEHPRMRPTLLMACVPRCLLRPLIHRVYTRMSRAPPGRDAKSAGAVSVSTLVSPKTVYFVSLRLSSPSSVPERPHSCFLSIKCSKLRLVSVRINSMPQNTVIVSFACQTFEYDYREQRANMRTHYLLHRGSGRCLWSHFGGC